MTVIYDTFKIMISGGGSVGTTCGRPRDWTKICDNIYCSLHLPAIDTEVQIFIVTALKAKFGHNEGPNHLEICWYRRGLSRLALSKEIEG